MSGMWQVMSRTLSTIVASRPEIYNGPAVKNSTLTITTSLPVILIGIADLCSLCGYLIARSPASTLLGMAGALLFLQREWDSFMATSSSNGLSDTGARFSI